MQRTQTQQTGIQQTLIWIFGFIALVLGLFLYSFLAPRGLSDEKLRTLGYYGFNPTREISDFELVVAFKGMRILPNIPASSNIGKFQQKLEVL